MNHAKIHSVYVHIPFCRKKCGYCDFLSFEGGDAPAYFGALRRQIEGFPRRAADTVYIGGGTPSVVPAEYIAESLAMIPAVADAEITVEANPESAAPDKLAAYRAAGANRLSVGAQSFDDRLLARLGRVHSAGMIGETLRAARRAGFDNVSLDLMYALPDQTEEDWRNTLAAAVSLGPEHISCYALSIEEGTPFGRGGALPADESAELRMYESAGQILSEAGYQRYEISNYAKPGFECRHNIGYWTGAEYAGFGLGAHSCVGGRRFRVTRRLPAYLAGDFAPRDAAPADAMSEYMYLGLRMSNGVSLSGFEREFGAAASDVFGAAIGLHIRRGALEISGDRLRLTPLGVYVSNMILSDFTGH